LKMMAVRRAEARNDLWITPPNRAMHVNTTTTPHDGACCFHVRAA